MSLPIDVINNFKDIDAQAAEIFSHGGVSFVATENITEEINTLDDKVEPILKDLVIQEGHRGNRAAIGHAIIGLPKYGIPGRGIVFDYWRTVNPEGNVQYTILTFENRKFAPTAIFEFPICNEFESLIAPKTPVDVPEDSTVSDGTPWYLCLMVQPNQPKISEEQIVDFLMHLNPNLAKDYISEIVKIYYIEAKRESINVILAIAQMFHETGYLKFNGTVKKEQNNFAGIGCVSSAERGVYFTTQEVGIRAHIQHLKTYASQSPLNSPCVDTRRKIVQGLPFYGKVKTISGLNKTWAADPNYSKKVEKIIHRLLDIYNHQVINANGEIRLIMRLCPAPDIRE